MQTLKTLTMIAAEYGFTPKTLYNHIQKHEVLRTHITRGLQTPRFQKMLYDTLGYPPCVNKNDYVNV